MTSPLTTSFEELFLHGVLVEPGGGAQAAGGSGAGAAPGIQVAGEALDIGRRTADKLDMA